MQGVGIVISSLKDMGKLSLNIFRDRFRQDVWTFGIQAPPQDATRKRQGLRESARGYVRDKILMSFDHVPTGVAGLPHFLGGISRTQK